MLHQKQYLLRRSLAAAVARPVLSRLTPLTINVPESDEERFDESAFKSQVAKMADGKISSALVTRYIR